jgi:hypothetical protein
MLDELEVDRTVSGLCPVFSVVDSSLSEWAVLRCKMLSEYFILLHSGRYAREVNGE